MKAYPIKFDHPLEAVILNGIKDKIASRLADQYDKYCIGMGIPKPQHPRRSMATTASEYLLEPEEPLSMIYRFSPPNEEVINASN